MLHAVKRRVYILIAMMLFGCLGVSTRSDAQLMGSTLGWQYYAYGGPYSYPGGTTSGSFVVDGNVGGTFIGGTSFLFFDIIADDTSITFDYDITTVGPDFWASSPLSLAPTIHNGIAIDMLVGPLFVGVTIDPSTNMVGFDASRISFTGSQIQVDWQELPFDEDTIVKLNIAVRGGNVPEGSSVLMFSGGLLATGVGLLRRRRMRVTK
jgi:hypothetical protein